MSTSRALPRLAVGLVAAVVLALSGWYVASASDDLPENAVLRFDGRTVTKADLADRVKVLTALYGVEPPTSGPKVEEFRRESARSYAVGLILGKEAVRRKIVIADKQASDQLDALIDDQLQGGRDAFVEFLASSGISESDVLDEIKRQLATARVVEAVTKDLPAVTDAEVSAFYAENKAKMVSDPTRTLSNIVVADQAQAARIARLARGGSDFATLARKYSADGSTKDKGGALGAVTVDQLEAGYGKAAFAVGAGQVFGPVQTQYGWNVGRVDAVSPSKPLALADVRTALKTELENKARLARWRSLLGTLLRSADVEYAAAYRPDHPETAPTDLPQEAK